MSDTGPAEVSEPKRLDQVESGLGSAVRVSQREPLRRIIATSSHPLARGIRALYGAVSDFTLPAPRFLVVPLLWLYLALRTVVFFVRRRFLAEPLLKAYCTKVGRGVTAGVYVPWVQGRGEIILGDRVHIDGYVGISFASRFVVRPRLVIGAHTGIGHGTQFVVGREIVIGAHVRIAADVEFRDSNGHASDPALRLMGAPPDPSEVRAIRIHDNVWIGKGTLVLPGTEIGEGSIVAGRSVVSGVVAPYTVVAGNPARRIGTLTVPTGATSSTP